MYAFVCGADEKVNAEVSYWNVDAAKTGHGVNNIGFAGCFYDFGDGGNVVENTGSSFAMYHGYVGNRRIDGEDFCDFIAVRGLVIATVVQLMRQACAMGNFCHSLTICAVGDNQ